MTEPLVMIVEDDPGARSVLSMLLEGEGLLVAEAADGRTGLTMAERIEPDVIVTDLRMPRMSGIEMARALADSDPNGAPAPVIAVTSAEARVREAAEGSGLFVKVLTKPIVPQTLLSWINQAVQDREKGGTPS